MFNKFSEETKKIISLAKYEMIELNHPYLGSEHIMLGILKNNNNISNLLKNYNVTYKKYKDELKKVIGIGKNKVEWILYTPIVKEIFERAIDISNEEKTKVSIDNIFVALLEMGDCLANRVFRSLNVNLDKIYTEVLFKVPKKEKKKKTILDEIGYEYTNKNIVKNFDPVIGREEEIKQVIEILCRKNKSNPILVGDAGVGKSAIVEEISKMIVDNKVPNKLKNKRIINIDMSSAVAGTKYRGEFEEKLNKIVHEAELDDNIILFIDEIHTIVGAGGAEGAIDASNIFKPALARGNIKCIGATTIQEYKEYIEKDKALCRRFKKVLIEEPKKEQLNNIIHSLKHTYEEYHRVKISNKLLELLINLSNKYIHQFKNPDKTIDILDEVCAHANLKENKYMKEYEEVTIKLSEVINNKKNNIIKSNFKKALEYKKLENKYISKLNELEFYLSTSYYNEVTKEDLLYVLSNKVNTPIVELNNKIDKQEIINKLQSIVIDQNKSIKKLVDSYFMNLNNNRCYSALLCGTSGIGKTLLAQSFGKILGANIIRIDMSEFSESHSVSKLVGAPPGYVGYENSNYIFDSINEYPFSLILLDEVDKCSSSVLNVFFQILDNNKIKDSKGNTIYFNNCIIIMTTNVEVNGRVGFNNIDNNSNINDYFSKEFINRIDDIINLDSLTKDSVIKIINKNIDNSKMIDNEMLIDILNKSNYKEYGARKVKNLINKTINAKKIKKFDKNYSKN